VRLALDLHDGPLQELAALGFTLNLLQRRLESLPADTTEVAGDLEEVQRQLGAIETTLRAVATQRHLQDDDATLLELVDREVARFNARSTATVVIEVVGDVEPATASQRIAIHRVLQEALANVARHSGATEVRIELVESAEAIHLRVVDNGKGFDPQARCDQDGRARLGLTGMRRRIELLDGQLTVDSQPGGPTSVTAAVKRWRPAEAQPLLVS
jgi:signal transduction histidine kinase